MKKFLVIGNPIEHSLSPELHNFWIKKNNLNAEYQKKLIKKKEELPSLVSYMRSNEIDGMNVTVPFKQDMINFVDKLSPEAELTKSVNTLYKKDELVFGHNTDIAGFELAIRHAKFPLENKNALIIGAGGVVPSIIVALKNLNVSAIKVMNRTYEKALKLKQYFEDIDIVKWGDHTNFDIIINATSIGLNVEDDIGIDFYSPENKKYFFDVIYNPKETNFLKNAKQNFHTTENGKLMFIYQAHQSFTIWHNLMPEIDEEVMNLF